MENQYNYYDPETEHSNGSGYSNTGSGSSDNKNPKKKRNVPKGVKAAGCGLAFGVVAGAAFLGVSAIGTNVLGIGGTKKLRKTSCTILY